LTVTNPGNYNVTGTTALGCTATVNATSVTVNPAPTATFTSQPTSTSGSYQFTNTSTGASTYQWNFGNGTTSTSLNPTNVYAQSGSYTVTLVATSAANCAATVTQVLNNIIGSNETTQTAAALTISPNPTTGLLDLHWNNQQNLKAQKLQLLDIQGRQVLEKQITDFSQSLQLDLSTFDAGVYILRVGASAFRVIKE
jgi:PKD repeat protein